MTDHVKDQLCARIEELEKEKLELNEQVDSLQEERDALSAHVERIQSVERDETEYGRNVMDILDYAPAISLARLKAQWQADAVSTFAFHHLGGHEQEVAEIYASRLRRQAEGE